MSKPATTAESSSRRRWRIADARSVLAAMTASGLSLPAFANREKLEPQRLRRWQRRLARDARPARSPRPVRRTVPAPPALIELRPTPSPRRAEPIEIVLASGVVVRVAETIDPRVLAQMVTALRGC